MTSYTPNLKLLKKNPSTDGNDTFNITTMINDNWDKVDTAFADKMSKDFSNVAYDSLGFDNFVNNLCDLKALTRLTIGSYVGTGTYGANNPVSLTFDFEPKILVVRGKVRYAAQSYRDETILMVKGTNKYWSNVMGSTGTYSLQEVVTWDGNTVSWYTTSTGSYPAYRAGEQLNVADSTYNYFAIV